MMFGSNIIQTLLTLRYRITCDMCQQGIIEALILNCTTNTRVLLIWHFAKFCYVHVILGLIYPIRANALGFFALKCLNPIGAETN